MGWCGVAGPARLRRLLALACLSCISCTPHEQAPVDGVPVLDEDVQLMRGEHRDSAQREFKVDSDATFVAFVHEEDCDVKLRLESQQAGGAPESFVEVANSMYGEGIEVAALDVARGHRLTLRMDSPQDTDVPCHSRLRVLRYDAAAASRPEVAARLAAFRAWTAATRAGRTRAETKDSGLKQMDVALAHLESAQGDRWLAAWARLIRATINTDVYIDQRQGARDVRIAWRTFQQLGDAHGVARSRYELVTTLVEIELNKAGTEPTAEEAAREAESILQTLLADPALSAIQQIRARNLRGYHHVNTGKWKEAEADFRVMLDSSRAIGNRQGVQQALHQLGVLAAEVGDFVLATQYFDPLVAMLDQVGVPENRVQYLQSAARADIEAGRVDRAIERLLLALQWNRDLHAPQLDARIVHALGRAYWARGDIAQASAFFNEGLRIRRTIEDAQGLIASIRYVGMLARATGNIDDALRMHREAVGLAPGNEKRLREMLEVALDFAAIPDYRRAIATCRESLALPSANPEFYKRYETQLTLGELLLSQPKPSAAAIAEAESLAAAPLAAALRRSDIGMELAARHLRARALAARHQLTQARAEYERAIALIFKYSSASTNPELQAATLAREQATIRGYLDLLMRDSVTHGPGTLRSAAQPETDALLMLEWARARSISNSRAASLDPESAARVDALLTRMAGKRVRITALLDRAGDTSRDVERLQLEIAELRAEIDRISASARPATLLSDASFLGAPGLPPLTVGISQWSYALGNDHAYLWVRDRAGIRTVVLPATPAEIERQLVALTAVAKVQAPEKAEAALEQLAPLLVPRAALREQASELEIVAEGNLARVPFAALRAPDAGTVTMVNSFFHSVESTVPRVRAMRFAGVAASASGTRGVGERVFSPLASTLGETRSIAAMFEQGAPGQRVKLLSGNDASGAALESLWRGGVDVLHVATHGLADLRQPMTSLLLLPANDAAGDPTYLTAGQVQQWSGDADLVYLSACETAVGPARFAEGMPGLQRAFLRAGARGVIATLWPIEDMYASQFATQFYQRYTAGMPAAQALSETQRAWRVAAPGISRAEQARRRMTAWAHVYYTR